MNKSNLNELFEKKAFWKKERNRCLQKVYHNLVLPWIIVGIGSLIWLVMDWGVLTGWIWIVLALSSAIWGFYWIIKVNDCSSKLSLIDEEIARELSKKREIV